MREDRLGARQSEQAFQAAGGPLLCLGRAVADHHGKFGPDPAIPVPIGRLERGWSETRRDVPVSAQVMAIWSAWVILTPPLAAASASLAAFAIRREPGPSLMARLPLSRDRPVRGPGEFLGGAVGVGDAQAGIREDHRGVEEVEGGGEIGGSLGALPHQGVELEGPAQMRHQRREAPHLAGLERARLVVAHGREGRHHVGFPGEIGHEAVLDAERPHDLLEQGRLAELRGIDPPPRRESPCPGSTGCRAAGDPRWRAGRETCGTASGRTPTPPHMGLRDPSRLNTASCPTRPPTKPTRSSSSADHSSGWPTRS